MGKLTGNLLDTPGSTKKGRGSKGESGEGGGCLERLLIQYIFSNLPGWCERDKNLAEILSLVRISRSVSRGGGSVTCSSAFCAGELVPRVSK